MLPAFFSSLQVRFLVLLLLAVLPGFGLTCYLGFEQRQRAVAEARDDAVHLVHLAAANHEQLIETERQWLATVAQLPEVLAGDPSACQRRFAELRQQYPRYANLAVVTSTGETVCSALPFTPPVSVVQREWFQRVTHTRAFAAGDYQVGTLTGKATINVALPIIDGAQEIQAIINAALDVRWLNDRLAEAIPPEGTTVSLLDRQGAIVARYPDPDRWVGRSLPDAQIIRTVLAQGEGTVDLPDLDGVARLFAFKPLIGTGPQSSLAIVVGIAKAMVYADADWIFIRSLIALGAVALLIVTADWAGAEWLILRPITALVKATGQVAAGDLSARTGLAHGQGELGQLARAFDDMAHALEVRQAEALQAAVARQRAVERLELLQQIDRALLAEEEPEAIAAAALVPLRELLGVPRAIVNLFDLAAGEVEWLAAAGRRRMRLGPGIRYSIRLMGDVEALQRGEPQVIDVHTLPSSPEVDALLASGVQMYMVVPMIVGGELIGALSFGGAPGPFPTEQVSIAQEAAMQFAIAIAQARLHARVKRQAEELERRVQERTADLRHANDALQTEIAERRRVEEALAHSLAQLQATLEATADGILVTDHAGKITHVNRTFVELWRIPESLLASQDAAQLQAYLGTQVTASDGLPALTQILPAATDPDRPAILDRTDGRVFECAAQPQRVGDTRVGTVWSVREITQRRAAEQLKDAFVSTVSHELRTPLSSIRGFAELLLERSFAPERQREFMTIIHRETLRLTQLINDFLDLQRIESGRQVFQMARVDLGPVLRETIALFNINDTHALHLEVPEPLPLVEADADRIRQVLTNLLSNAVKFSPQGGAVTLGARHEGDYVQLWVADHGVGIPAEALPQLFSKFFRVDNRETRSVGGTGLGLALVKEIVEAHRGRVWVESVVGQGSTVWFTLPVAAPVLPLIGPPEGVTAGGTDIMLVEDDAAFAQLLCTHFEGTGLSVAIIDRAERALKLVRQAPPRVLLVDLELAGTMDGWDLLVALKSDPACHTLPVLIISASAEANRRGLALGGADYLLKPVTREALLHAIRRRLPSRPGNTVLVADDDAVFRRQVGASLAAAGEIRVVEAANGREALAYLTQHMPDVLVLDLLMPDIDGFEVLRQLRADRRAMNLPVLVVTGKDLDAREKASLKHNLASLVSKQEASLDYFARIIGHVLDLREGTYDTRQ
jgi:signal transduction histidine kinase/DNA-binding response OmpR family regulator/HAMP domain-containing protein